MPYAVGKHAIALCDRCGFQVPYLSLKEEWNGNRVCKECYEPKHPQLEPKGKRADAEALRHPRPAPDEDPVSEADAAAYQAYLDSRQ